MKKKIKLHWTLAVTCNATLSKGRPKDAMHGFVSIVQMPNGWVAVAGESKGKDVDSFLSGHAHKNLGTFDLLDEAMAAGETFLSYWKDRKEAEAQCGCKDIP